MTTAADLQHASTLLSLLQAEHEALISMDVARLESIQASKSVTVEQLAKAHNGAGSDATPTALAGSMAELAAQLKQQNEINQRIAAQQMSVTQDVLRALQIDDSTPGTYGPTGEPLAARRNATLARA